MSITKTYLNNDMPTLKTFLEQLIPDYFASVDIDNSVLSISDSDNNVLCTITPHQYGYQIELFSDASTSVVCETHGSGASSKVSLAFGFLCGHGAMIFGQTSGTSKDSCLMITKTSNGKTAFISGAGYSATASSESNFTTVYSVAWGDASPLASFGWGQSNAGNQTMVVPFPTSADLNATSYTPNAGYIPMGQYYSIGSGIIAMNQKEYVTNGYWVLED